MRLAIVMLALAGAHATACTGSIADTSGAARSANGDPAAVGGGAAQSPAEAGPLARGLLTSCDESQAAAPPQRVWMLTPEQIPHSVAALYETGPQGPAIAAITAENRTYDGNDADLLKLNTEQARGLLSGADGVGKFVSTNLSSLLICPKADASCFATFMTDFATRAWRVPPTQEQLSRLRAVYDVGAEVSEEEGYGLAVSAVLKSPRFIFRTEIGAPDGSGRFLLTPWETASQLSYLLVDAPPDAELRGLAASGAIAAPEVFSEQARRLLADARARGIASRFLFQMTSARSVHGLAKSPSVLERFDESVTSSLLDELRLFSERVFFEPAGNLATLLTSQESMGDATVASLYGITSPASGVGTLAVGPTRAGFLTMPVLMSVLSQADHVVPTARGRFVLDKLLCTPIAAPPSFPSDAPAASPTLSPRERLAVMQDFPACAACHNRADPVGFAFDHFDPVGRFVTEVKGVPVDPSGEVKNTQLTDGPFANVAQLAGKLASSSEVRACVNWQFLEFAQGRTATTSDACSILGSQQAFEASDGRLQTLLEQVLALKSLQVRSASR